MSSCWEKNFIRNNTHNFSILSLVFLKLLIVSVPFFLGHPVYGIEMVTLNECRELAHEETERPVNVEMPSEEGPFREGGDDDVGDGQVHQVVVRGRPHVLVLQDDGDHDGVSDDRDYDVDDECDDLGDYDGEIGGHAGIVLIARPIT